MRVILEVMSGPHCGRKASLGAFQTIQVGRTEQADFSVPNDGRVSSLHFVLETDAANCYLTDLGSRNGTALNGRRIAERTALRSEDEIIAGSTIFHVTIESDTLLSGSRVEGTPETVPAIPTVVQTASAALPKPLKRGTATYTLEPCASELVVCSGSTEEIRPTDLANLLGVKLPLHLIVDPRKIENKPVEGIDYLFNWIPPEAARLASPVVVSAASYSDWPAIVEQGWGNDAVVCLFSRYEKPNLMEHLRNCLRAKPKQTEMSAGIIGYCWPGVMSMLLSHGMHNFVQNFFTGIEAVLIELPDLPEIWQIYGFSSIAQRIEDLGFVRNEPRVRVGT